MKLPFLITAVFLTAYYLSPQDRLILSKPEVTQNTTLISGERILREAYSRLDIEVEFRIYPTERSLINAAAGITDGELQRISGLEKAYPDLIMVNRQIGYIEIMVFTAREGLKATGWKSLENYRIGHLIGIKVIESRTRGMDVIQVSSAEQLFRMLSLKRLDTVIHFRDGIYTIRRLDLTGIRMLEPPLEQIPVYHYLHRRHSALVPRLEEVLREMEEDGTMKRIRSQVLEELRSVSQPLSD